MYVKSGFMKYRRFFLQYMNVLTNYNYEVINTMVHLKFKLGLRFYF